MSDVEIVEDLSKEPQKEGNYAVAIVIAAIIIIIAAILSLQYFMKNDEPTLDEMHQENLEGDIGTEHGYLYNGYSFVKYDGLWYTKVLVGNVVFSLPLHYGPLELKDVTVSGALDDTFNDRNKIYLAFNPDIQQSYVQLAAIELGNNIVNGVDKEFEIVCDRTTTEECKKHPVMNCSSNAAVIHMIHEPGPKIELEGNCVKLIGVNEDLLMAAERLIYQWYSVML